MKKKIKKVEASEDDQQCGQFEVRVDGEKWLNTVATLAETVKKLAEALNGPILRADISHCNFDYSKSGNPMLVFSATGGRTEGCAVTDCSFLAKRCKHANS
jgi:hypothetical protein